MTKLRWEWTVPNILSLFRIALIPVLVLTYLSCDDIWLPASVLVLSGLTDLLDGWIARHFNQISEIGKLLDPIADKLTQFTVVVCLATTYPSLWWLVALVAVKEILQGIGGLLLLNKNVKVVGAKWFGKVSTTLFYVVMVALVLGGMPLTGGPRSRISAGLIGAATITVLNMGLTMMGLSTAMVQIFRAIVFIAVVYVASMTYRTKLLPR